MLKNVLKKLTALIAALTLTASAVCAVPAAAASYTTLVNEDYENGDTALFADSGIVMGGTEEYGIGSNSVKLMGNDDGRGAIVNSAQFAGTAVYSDADVAKLNENCFVETEFDLLSENAVSVGGTFSILLTGKKDAADFSKNRGLLQLYFNDNGQYTGDTSVKGIKAEYCNKDESGNFSPAFKTLSPECVDGKWYRIKIVKQITNENKLRASRIVSVSINGETVLEDVSYKTPWNSIKNYDTIRFYIYGKNGKGVNLFVDNLKITRYNNEANAPVDKSGIVSAIRNADRLISEKTFYDVSPEDISEITALRDAAAAACENESDIPQAENALREKLSLYSKNNYERLAYEDFERSVNYFKDGTTVDNSGYGMGEKAVRLTTNPQSRYSSGVFAKNINLFNGTKAWENGANCYVRTSFDVKVDKIKDTAATVTIPLTSDLVYTTYKGESVGITTLKFDGDSGNIVALSSTGEVILKEFEDNEWYRITVVNQITDAKAAAAQLQKEIYINGVSVLDSEMTYVSTNQTKLPYYNSILAYIFSSAVGEVYFDNVSVIKYNGEENAPILKDSLLTQIRTAETKGIACDAMTKAQTVYADKNASQAAVDEAYEELMTVIDERSKIITELTWDKISSQPQEKVTSDIALPKTLETSYGTYNIKWKSSNEIIVSNDGKVVAPKNNQKIKLTATLTEQNSGEVVGKKDFCITVIGDKNSYLERVSIPSVISANEIVLPSFDDGVTTTTVTSDNESVITNDGKVIQPTDKAIQVNITVKLSREGETDATKVIPVTVMPKMAVEINSVKYTDANNNTVYGPVNNGKLSTINVIKNTEQNAKIVAAVYDDEALDNVKIIDAANGECNVDLALDADGAKKSVKFFVWSDFSEIKPLQSTIEYTGAASVYVLADSIYAENPTEVIPTGQVGIGKSLKDNYGSAVTINNLAWCGTSTKSFANSYMLNSALNDIKPGDYAIISFAHNDEKSYTPGGYAPLDTNTTAPFTAGTYQANLARYIDEVREQGATPILITALPRLVYGNDGQLSETHGGYIQAMKDVAAAKDCLLIDLNGYAKTEIGKLSQSDAEKLYNSGDATHLSAQGAALFANYISDCIDSFKLPLSAYRLK